MAPPRPVASALQAAADEEEERSDSFPLTWILAIIFNVLFIIGLFIALIYCIKRRKQKKPDQQEETKTSPIFRKRTISQSFGAANFHFSTPSSAGSFRTSSSSSKKSRKSNRVSSTDMVDKVQTKEQIESARPISPVRYDSPGPPKPLSSVFTVQQATDVVEKQAKGLLSQASAKGQPLIDLSGRKPSISFKNLALMQARLRSEMGDSRVKIKTLEFDKQSNDPSEENSKGTINNDIESLDSTEVINEENDSIMSLSVSGDEADAGADKKKHRTKRADQENDQGKDELIEQLSAQMIKEQAGQQIAPTANGPVSRPKLNDSEAELTYVSDSGLGDSQANLSSVTQLANLPTSIHVPNIQQPLVWAAATAANASTSILAAKSIGQQPINKPLSQLDSFSKRIGTPPPAKDSSSVQVGSVKEFSFSQTTRPDRPNESGIVDKQLHELQSNSKAIGRHDSKKSRNGSGGKRKRMKSAGVQTTPSLRRSTPQPRPIQNNESTFSMVYTDIASKLDPAEKAEQLANMQPIEEENFFYDPESEQQERKYFIYLISDTSNPYYKKDCIGKILLPARGQLTLSDLRDQLFKQSEDSVKTILKKGKNFRFLTETYRFVSQNESIASVKEVYPTQGIFLKLNTSDVPPAYGRAGKNPKADLTNLISAALNEGKQAGASPHPAGPAGLAGGKGAQRQINLKAYNKDLANLNREAASIGDLPRVQLSRAEQDNSPSPYSPLPPFLSVNNNTPSLRTVTPDQRSAVLREALFRRHGRCLYPQPIVRRALPKQAVSKGELSKKCNFNGCRLISMLKCAKCGRAFYCSSEHKHEHWPVHRAHCQRPPWRL